MKPVEGRLPAVMIAVALAVSALSVYVAAQRALTGLEVALLQVFVLFFGLAGSFLFGRQSAKDAAREIIRPHARSAFRRLMSLYLSLRRVGVEITSAQAAGQPQDKRVVFARLEAIVIEQLATADDAIEDWYDIVPEDVKELRERLVATKPEGRG